MWKDLSPAVWKGDWMGLEWSWGNQVITVVQVREAGSFDSRGSSGDGEMSVLRNT